MPMPITRSPNSSSSSADIIFVDSGRKRSPKKKSPPSKDTPGPHHDIIEISSDEDEEPVAPRARKAAATSESARLRKRVHELERENARIRRENEQVKKDQETALKKANLQTTAELEEQVTCEVCASKMWSPFILPDCGHTFCQRDLEAWFATALNHHLQKYPHYQMQMGYPYGMRGGAYQQPSPQYVCPKCRTAVRSRPIQNFAMKNIVRTVASQIGESSPKRPTGSATDHVWDRFFPPRA